MEYMSDDEFAAAVEQGETPNEGFRHRDHLRLAWIYLRRYRGEAGARIAQTIRRFAARHGKPDLYHETVTQAWLRLVAAAARDSFEETLHAHPSLLDKHLLEIYYSPELLASTDAKFQFLAPDRKPLLLTHNP